MRRHLLLGLAALAALALAANLLAQGSPVQVPPGTPTSTLNGTVVAVSASELVIETPSGRQRFIVDVNSTLPANLAAGTRVSVEYHRLEGDRRHVARVTTRRARAARARDAPPPSELDRPDAAAHREPAPDRGRARPRLAPRVEGAPDRESGSLTARVAAAMPKPKRATRTLRALHRALSGIALLALSYCAYVVIGTEVQYAREDQRLEELMFASTSDPPRQRARSELRRSGLIGRLEVPRLGLLAIVREGVDDDTLRFAAGHVPGTALPGEPGNVVIAAHRDTLFRPLADVRPGTPCGS